MLPLQDIFWVRRKSPFTPVYRSQQATSFRRVNAMVLWSQKISLLHIAPVENGSNLSCPVDKKVCLCCPGSASLLCSPLECASSGGLKRQTRFWQGKWKPFVQNKNIFKGNFIPEEALPENRLIEEYWYCGWESKLLGACVWPVTAHPWLRMGICCHSVQCDREKEMWPRLLWVTYLMWLLRRWVKNGHGLG